MSTQGGQGRDVLDAAIAGSYQSVSAFDIGESTALDMVELLPLSALRITAGEDYFVGARRSDLVRTLVGIHLASVSLAQVVHPRAYVSPFASLAENVFVGAMAVVNPQARIGSFVFINAGCLIDHDCVIGSGTTLGPGVTFPGFVTIGEDCAIGAGVVARPGVKVASGCTLGAGAVIVGNIEDPGVYVGNPARKL